MHGSFLFISPDIFLNLCIIPLKQFVADLPRQQDPDIALGMDGPADEVHSHAGPICYRDMSKVAAVCGDDLETVCANIREKLIAGVEKRLEADVPVGFLLGRMPRGSRAARKLSDGPS